MALPTQPYKGARDFYPEDKRLQKHIFNVMRHVAERYGYEEYDAPILESLELYLAKTGDEIVNEQTYAFEDRGGRQVVIRPEMTPTVSRMVAARRQDLAYPLRWYSLPNLWRYERPQHGRLREHWQLNVDLFGLTGIESDSEIITLANDIFKEFGATPEMYEIHVNNRQLTDFILFEYLELSPVQAHTITKLIDRMHKMPMHEFMAEIDAVFTPSQREDGHYNRLVGLLKIKELEHLPEVIRNHPVAVELGDLLSDLKEINHINNVSFDITLVRGFDYYTGTVFEVFDKHPDNNRAMMGGGRYDGLVELFGVDPVPTVGFGLGDVTLEKFLVAHDLLPKLKTETDAYVIFIGDVYERAQEVVNNMRTMGANLAVDLTSRKADKQIKVALKKDIRYVIFIGEKELTDELYTIRNLASGTEERHSASRIVSIIKDYRTDDLE